MTNSCVDVQYSFVFRSFANQLRMYFLILLRGTGVLLGCQLGAQWCLPSSLTCDFNIIKNYTQDWPLVVADYTPLLRHEVASASFVCYIGMRWCCGASSIAPAGPPTLTAKQLARKKKEAERIAAQLAKPSYWDEVGPRSPNASALKAALADTVLVDAAWLARLADEGGVLPRCQDLPPGARVTLKQMEKWQDSGPLGVLVISYPWWAPPHSTPRR